MIRTRYLCESKCTGKGPHVLFFANCDDAFVWAADEMYQLLSSLPEEMQYTCRVCCPSGPAQWQSVLRQELLAGLRSVIDSLASFKCAHHLVCIDETVSEETVGRRERVNEHNKFT